MWAGVIAIFASVAMQIVQSPWIGLAYAILFFPPAAYQIYLANCLARDIPPAPFEPDDNLRHEHPDRNPREP